MSKYYRTINSITSIDVNDSVEGESIEMKVMRITQNNEPITDGAPTIYTERKDGVLPDYNIRTDRFDVAIDAMDFVNKSKRAQRNENMRIVKGGEEDGGAESTQATT